jgi:hypothetical protein
MRDGSAEILVLATSQNCCDMLKNIQQFRRRREKFPFGTCSPDDFGT